MPSKSKMERKVESFIEAKTHELEDIRGQIQQLQAREQTLGDEIELLESLLIEDENHQEEITQ